MMPVTGLRFVSQTSWDVSSMIALGSVFISFLLTVTAICVLNDIQLMFLFLLMFNSFLISSEFNTINMIYWINSIFKISLSILFQKRHAFLLLPTYQ